MKKYYIIETPVNGPGIKVLTEFEAKDNTEAKTRFSQYVGAMLEEYPNSKHRLVIFERWLGGWVDQSLAHATAEDLLPETPEWFVGDGYYDESNNLALGTSQLIDRFTLGNYTYLVTALKPKAAQE